MLAIAQRRKPMPRITINDYEKWGELVKGWVKGSRRRPNNVQELKDQVEPLNIAQVPNNITQLLFMPQPDNENVLVIYLPTKKAIEDVETKIASGLLGDKYPFPRFYENTFGRPLTPDEFQKLNTERVGEYTIQECQ
jgi:hypothetical protein